MIIIEFQLDSSFFSNSQFLQSVISDSLFCFKLFLIKTGDLFDKQVYLRGLVKQLDLEINYSYLIYVCLLRSDLRGLIKSIRECFLLSDLELSF